MTVDRRVRRTVALFLAAATLAPAQVAVERLEQHVQAYFEQEKFTGTVLVAQAGRTVLAKGYGMANYEWNVPNTPSTKFRLASLTKQFTAAAILHLAERGKLSVDDPIARHLSDTPDRWQAITIHHLLTHTSGIPNFTSFPDYNKTMMLPSPAGETMKRFVDKPLDFDPGTKYSYSNSGYVLLGLIIEKASGMSYADYVWRNIFEPLGMQDSGYDSWEEVIPQRASGYTRDGDRLRNALYIDMSIPGGAGALYSTVEDLKKWDEALYTDKLLPPAAIAKMFTPFRDNYAYGWFVRQLDGKTVVGHTGGINGFATSIVRVPDDRILVVALSNVLPSQAARLSQELVQLMQGREVALPTR